MKIKLKQLKAIGIGLAKTLIAIGIMYIIFVGVSLELNPINWGWFGRLIFLLYCLSCIAASGLADYISKLLKE